MAEARNLESARWAGRSHGRKAAPTLQPLARLVRTAQAVSGLRADDSDRGGAKSAKREGNACHNTHELLLRNHLGGARRVIHRLLNHAHAGEVAVRLRERLRPRDCELKLRLNTTCRDHTYDNG